MAIDRLGILHPGEMGITVAISARNRTWLYLAGKHTAEAAEYFGAGPIEVQMLEGGTGRASPLKSLGNFNGSEPPAILNHLLKPTEVTK
jgi:hypothetical protein